MTNAALWRSHRVRLCLLAIAWALFVAAVYCPDLGRGFVKDDFTWIRAAKTAIASPSTIVFQRDPVDRSGARAGTQPMGGCILCFLVDD